MMTAGVVLLAVWLFGGVPNGHPPPTVHVRTEITAERVDMVVVCELPVWNAWLGLDISGEYQLSDDDRRRIQDRAEVFLHDKNPVLIDGERVFPAVDKVIVPEDYSTQGVPSVEVCLVYRCAAPPRAIDFRWQVWEGTDLFERRAVPAMIRWRTAVDQAMFTPDEPQFIWHARDVAARRAVAVEGVGAAAPGRWSVPLGSIGMVLSLVLLLPLMRRAVPAVPGWGVAAVVVLAAVVLRDVGSVSVRPPWNRVAMPSEDEALQLFEVLQNNVYRAFSARTEDEIYDLLAVSVDPEILDQLYGDVYESLILRGQGGAVCVIDRIEVLDKSIAGFDDSGGSPRFDVNWQWRVFGVVSHWGHQHKRTNQYRARYSVHHDGHSWKIAKVVVLDHSRVDEDG